MIAEQFNLKPHQDLTSKILSQLCYHTRKDGLPFKIERGIYGENKKTKLRFYLITMSSKDDSNRSGLEIYFTEKGKMNFRVIKPNREAEKSHGTKHNDAERIKELLGAKVLVTYNVGKAHSTHVLSLANDDMTNEILFHPYKGRTIHGRLNLKNNTR